MQKTMRGIRGVGDSDDVEVDRVKAHARRAKTKVKPALCKQEAWADLCLNS